MTVESGTAVPGQSGWVVYYDGPGVVVTSWYVMNAAGRYPVTSLTEVRQVHLRSGGPRLTAVIAGATAVIVAVPLSVPFGYAALLVAAAAAVVGGIAAQVVDRRYNPRWMALWATHQGRDIELFGSSDKQQFEQVRRAVIRAVQINRDPWS
ncbi:hypothetical protein GCM10010435_36650 [Winogradskya consettensis]|uniref:Uncharacterized protein n=1 Tax=Winogradskya consettensis TaxID=113560 RepID=A0A919VW46_9ACTN|nr:DUF6232 family protein [Actinoplanes consettensis]GIM81642.1 hypothetical protein Aco04nite_77600 [Actinoplanes consettensis]